ncbi:MAG: DNA-3-methyladenine glycosylase 1 [Bacteroidota bacterium]|jgi:DNA-3-methyladenine glycosylase I
MEKPKTYCEAVAGMAPESVHRHYHDHEYGFPISDDNLLFARLVLEINQAGLSWTTILNKKDHFFRAFEGFELSRVAQYGEQDVNRLLNDPGIIRNRLKVQAVVHNAQVILDLQRQHGSFQAWLDSHHPKPIQDWVKLFKKTFKFTGGEIVNEFLMSTGYLPGAHVEECGVFAQVLANAPRWHTHR